MEITLSAVPLLPGTSILLEKGIRSSLHDANSAAVRMADDSRGNPIAGVLFDPQTSGGLLAALPRSQAEAAVDRLQAAGQTAAIIGCLTNAWTGLYPNRRD